MMQQTKIQTAEAKAKTAKAKTSTRSIEELQAELKFQVENGIFKEKEKLEMKKSKNEITEEEFAEIQRINSIITEAEKKANKYLCKFKRNKIFDFQKITPALAKVIALLDLDPECAFRFLYSVVIDKAVAYCEKKVDESDAFDIVFDNIDFLMLNYFNKKTFYNRLKSKIIDIWRKKSKKISIDNGTNDGAIEIEVYQDATDKIALSEIEEIAAELNEKEKKAILMKIQGFTHKEIAQSLGIEVSYSRVIINRTIKKLKQILQP